MGYTHMFWDRAVDKTKKVSAPMDLIKLQRIMKCLFIPNRAYNYHTYTHTYKLLLYIPFYSFFKLGHYPLFLGILWNQIWLISNSFVLFRTVPLAICISMAIVTIGYVLTNVAYFTTISAEELLLSNAVAVVSPSWENANLNWG